MIFTCNKNIFQNAISIAQKAVTGKTTMQILEGLLIKTENEEIIITGSDIDLSIETKITGDIKEEGSIVVDAKLFGDIIRKFPDENILIKTTNENTIEISCKKSTFNLIYVKPDEFPIIPSINENITLSISQKLLKNMIKGTIFSIAQEETRPILTGILFEIKNQTLNLVALDGYRLAVRSEKIENDNSINAVIPGKTLNEVFKILEDTDENVDITFSPNHILFKHGNTKVISRLLEGEFIKYNSIIPLEYNLRITVKREEILDSVERASLMGKEGNTNLVKLNIDNNMMIITSNSQYGNVREEIGIIQEGNSLQIAFNSKYLLDFLKIMEEEEIVMEFSSSVSPCVVKNKENNNCTYLVLPVRVSQD